MDSRLLLPRATEGATPRGYLLQFMSLFDGGRGVSVPCDEAGNVDMDTLTEHLRVTYLGARAMVGRDYACPTIKLAR